MLRLLERDPHGHRLRDLLARFHAQELLLAGALHDAQAELERDHRAASFERCPGTDGDHAMIAHAIALQRECDVLATELVHVRMAIAGTCEEVREHDDRRFEARPA